LKMAISKEQYQVAKDKKAEIDKINDDMSNKTKDLFTMKRDELDLQRQADQDEQEMEEYKRTTAVEQTELLAKGGENLEPEQIQLLAQDMNMTIPQFNAYYADYQADKAITDRKAELALAKAEKEFNTVYWETEKIDEGAYTYTYIYDPTDREGTRKLIGTGPRWKYTDGGDGGVTEEDFYDEASDFAVKLKAGKMDWGQAWNLIKTKYSVPDDMNYLIDELLGGGIITTVDEKTKQKTDTPWGWAKPGAYQSGQNLQ